MYIHRYFRYDITKYSAKKIFLAYLLHCMKNRRNIWKLYNKKRIARSDIAQKYIYKTPKGSKFTWSSLLLSSSVFFHTSYFLAQPSFLLPFLPIFFSFLKKKTTYTIKFLCFCPSCFPSRWPWVFFKWHLI